MILLKILGHLWALPLTVFALLATLTRYFPRRIRWRLGGIEVIPRWGLIPKGLKRDGKDFRTGGQTFGLFRFYREEKNWEDIPLVYHEKTHQKQQMIWGILYLFIYGGFFLWFWLEAGMTPYMAYMAIPFEVEAFKVQAEWKERERQVEESLRRVMEGGKGGSDAE